MARLLLATPEGQQTVELRDFNSLGRHPNNTVQVLDKIVSKEHCIIERRSGVWILRDLGSLNGTWINGERIIGERPLRHGDAIMMGASQARFDEGLGGPAVSPPAPQVAPAGGFAPGAAPPYGQPGFGSPAGGFPAAGPGATAPAAPAPLAPGAAPLPPGAGPPGAGWGSAAPPVPMRPAGAQPMAQAPMQAASMAPMSSAPFSGPLGATAPDQARRHASRTRVDISDQARAIANQTAATQKGFLPYDQLSGNSAQLAADYERLRLSHELSREVALERDLSKLLDKILLTIFKFVRADRGVIFLMDDKGELKPAASLRRDGTDAPISVSSTIMNHVIRERATVLTHDAAMDFAASRGRSMILNRISSAIVAPLLHDDDILGVLWMDSESLGQFQGKDMEIVTAIAGQAAMFVELNILGKKIEQEIVNRERFSRLLSPNIAERVLSGELAVTKGGQLVEECTVFNSDIRGFTSMSDGAPPQIIVDMLNEYFERMVETLFKYEGTLDKFMGDGIMALWGAPVAHPDDPTRAVQCALEMMEVLGQFNRERLELDQAALAIGIGIHTGPLVAGYIGSSRALSYTVIGDTANTSARLCGIAQPGQVLVSESTRNRLGSRFEFEALPPASLKGKEKPFGLFNVIREAPRVAVPANAPVAG